MRGSSLFVALLVALPACSSPSPDPPATAAPSQEVEEPAAAARAPVEGQALAYFAGGCFWGVEHYMEQLPGVASVESGYMGGHVDDPSYEQVASQTSGHFETVAVRYDPGTVGYEQIARRFFEIHDPTQEDGQGPDIGPEYRSVVFYGSDEEKAIAQSLIDRLEARGYEVVTELRPVSEFFRAEDYHQDYYVRKGTKPYCHTRVDRFGDG